MIGFFLFNFLVCFVSYVMALNKVENFLNQNVTYFNILIGLIVVIVILVSIFGILQKKTFIEPHEYIYTDLKEYLKNQKDLHEKGFKITYG